MKADSELVRVGEHISVGQPLGLVDPAHAHTHWEVRRQRFGPKESNTINPYAWYQFRAWGEPAIAVAAALVVAALARGLT